MNRDYSFSRSDLQPNRFCEKGSPQRLIADVDALARVRHRQQLIRGMASTLECVLSAVGGYSYSVLLGFRPGLSNTDAIKNFLEQTISEDDELPDVLTLAKAVQRSLDRALQLRDEI